jgi:hypothetical protein
MQNMEERIARGDIVAEKKQAIEVCRAPAVSHCFFSPSLGPSSSEFSVNTCIMLTTVRRKPQAMRDIAKDRAAKLTAQ